MRGCEVRFPRRLLPLLAQRGFALTNHDCRPLARERRLMHPVRPRHPCRGHGANLEACEHFDRKAFAVIDPFDAMIVARAFAA